MAVLLDNHMSLSEGQLLEPEVISKIGKIMGNYPIEALLLD